LRAAPGRHVSDPANGEAETDHVMRYGRQLISQMGVPFSWTRPRMSNRYRGGH
jgi:hypothetical protein